MCSRCGTASKRPPCAAVRSERKRRPSRPTTPLPNRPRKPERTTVTQYAPNRAVKRRSQPPTCCEARGGADLRRDELHTRHAPPAGERAARRGRQPARRPEGRSALHPLRHDRRRRYSDGGCLRTGRMDRGACHDRGVGGHSLSAAYGAPTLRRDGYAFWPETRAARSTCPPKSKDTPSTASRRAGRSP